MGSYSPGDDPRFYFYPDDAGTSLFTLDMAEPFTVLDPQPVGSMDANTSNSWAAYRQLHGHAFSVRLVSERFKDAGGVRERKLRAMINHLMRGGWVAFSHDHARTFGAAASTAPGDGDALIGTGGNLFTAFNASGSISASDQLVVQSPNPEGKAEQVQVATYTSGTGAITLSDTILLDHSATTFVRWKYFFPRLVLDPRANVDRLLSDEYHNTWTLDLPLLTQPDLEHAFIDQE